MRSPQNVLESLSSKACNSNYRYQRLYRNLYNPEFYLIAYQKIQAKQGNMTAGTDGKTVDGIGMKRINALIARLKDFSYQPAPARRTYIPKANGKKRPLGIPSFDDKLVQEVVRMILESIENTELPSIESFPFCSTPPALEAKGRDAIPKRGRSMDEREMAAYRSMIQENIRYDDFVREHPWDVGRLDEMVELMMETVCSTRRSIRIAGNDIPQAVVKSRLLKLDGEHIRFVFDCLQRNTTEIRNVKQYLLAVLYNAPVTMENHYASQVNHDLYGKAA